MNNLINEAIIPIINATGMTSLRMNHLIYLKEFIERISSRPYMKEDELKRLEAHYGARPDIITWGDYFQAEMATSMKDADDDEFLTAYETVKFDMISTYIIFRDKGKDFFDWIDNSFTKIEMVEIEKLSDHEKEIVHLKILMDYYLEIGINGRFTESELKWHSSFKEALAI